MRGQTRIASYDHARVFGWPWRINGDPRAAFLHRLDASKHCPFCAVPLQSVIGLDAGFDKSDYLFVCTLCGFWFGRGTYPDFRGFDPLNRGAIGLIRTPLDINELPVDRLIAVLNEDAEYLSKIDPFRAEEVVCEILRRSFGWDVTAVGGRRDGGVDAYAVIGEGLRSIVQIKWGTTTHKAESVSIVREFAGTLLARGIPSGIIVTTRKRFSNDAQREISELREREIVNVGRIDISYKTYEDLLTMFEISARRISENPNIPINVSSLLELFEIRGIFDSSLTHLAPSWAVDQLPELSDSFDHFEGSPESESDEQVGGDQSPTRRGVDA